MLCATARVLKSEEAQSMDNEGDTPKQGLSELLFRH
jgi:hypothetical protein